MVIEKGQVGARLESPFSSLKNQEKATKEQTRQIWEVILALPRKKMVDIKETYYRTLISEGEKYRLSFPDQKNKALLSLFPDWFQLNLIQISNQLPNPLTNIRHLYARDTGQKQGVEITAFYEVDEVDEKILPPTGEKSRKVLSYSLTKSQVNTLLELLKL